MIASRTSDEDGRFRVPCLLPGLTYQISDGTGNGYLADVKAASGEVKDLGNVRVQPPE